MYGVEIRPRRAASAARATIPIVIATGNEATNLMPVDAKPVSLSTGIVVDFADRRPRVSV